MGKRKRRRPAQRRSPAAAALRHFKPKIVADKRRKADLRRLEKEAEEAGETTE
ncbi:MAG: hypothetical protein ACT4P2_08800 [Pseudomonadota bacterium]